MGKGPGRGLVGEDNRSIFNYCRFGNFRVTFISRFFDFRIIREVLNSRASIRVVGNFRGLKLGMLIVVSIKLWCTE